MKIAIVYDRINKIGGAERVLQVFHDLFPNSVFYTSIYNPRNASWAREFKVKTSFLQKIKFIPHEFLPNLMSHAFRSFNFDQYDIVFSVSSAEGKYLRINKPTIHFTYCLTPTRYLWSGYFDYLSRPGFGFFNFIAKIWFIFFAPLMRMSDFEEAQKIDHFIAISEEIQKRIKKFYRRESEIIYPPVVLENQHEKSIQRSGSYFLIVSRLVPYKQIDLAIQVFNKLPEKKLVIVGEGSDSKHLKSLSKGDNIQFFGKISDQKLKEVYANSLALIFPGIEDFGLTSLEAQSFYKPVFCRKDGGTKETIVVGKTGELFDTPDELKRLIINFQAEKYQVDEFKKNIENFSVAKFDKQIKLIFGNIRK